MAGTYPAGARSKRSACLDSSNFQQYFQACGRAKRARLGYNTVLSRLEGDSI